TWPDPESTQAAALAWLSQLAGDYPRCDIHFILGNHDLRFGDPSRIRRSLERSGLVDLGSHERRIEIGGREEVIVQGCRENEANWILVLDVASRRCVLTIEKSLMQERPDHFVDSKVRVVAIAGATRNSRGEFLAPNLRLASPNDITVLEPAPSSAFAAPVVGLATIGRYRPKPMARRRIQTEGIVTGWVPGQYGYLQEGLVGVRVEAPVGPALMPGDRVRVCGFVDTSRNIAEITEGIVERIAIDRQPQPAAVTPAEISELIRWSAREGRIAEPSNYAGVLVTFRATVVERQRAAQGWSFTLSRDDTTTIARLQGGGAADDAAAARLAIGSEVSVTGVAKLDMAGPADLILTDNNADTGDIEILLRSMGDLTVIRPPSWWTARRLAIAAGLLAGVLAATAAWSVRLRQRGTLLSQQLAAEQQSRHEADVEFQATLRERSRLAANLHDTVLQTVTGIGYQLATCKDDDGSVSGDVAEALDLVERMVGHAVQQLRGTVWALKATAPRDRPLPHAVAELAVKLGHEYGRKLDIDVDEALPSVPDFVGGNLLLIAQEAMLNSLRHADGSLIKVSLQHDGAARAIVLTVRDDGRGFVCGNQGGTWEHHFGIEGMRERATQLGGTLTIESQLHAGTTVAVVVPTEVANGPGVAAPPPYEGPVSSNPQKRV
ncbi:MAG: histidine kinase, partial [Planctomycetota bacterium]